MHRIPFRFRSRLAILLVCAPCACRPAPAPKDEPAEPTAPASPLLPRDSNIREAALSNGVTYLWNPMPLESDLATFSLVVKAGAFSDNEHQAGFAHLVEHVAFRGTQHFTREEQETFFQEAGIALGQHVAAFVLDTHTYYTLQVPTSDPALVEQAISLLADWGSAVRFDAQTVSSAREIVLAEQRENAAADDLSLQILRHLMPGSSYEAAAQARLTPESILAATPSELEAFYRKWYHPENLALLAVGNFDPERVLELVDAKLGSIPRRGTSAPSIQVEVPVHSGPHFSVLKAHSDATVVRVLAQRPALIRATEGDYCVWLIDILLRQIIHARLKGLAREATSPLASIGPTLDVPGAETLELAGVARTGQLPDTARVLMRELRRLELHGVSAIEVQRARSTALQRLAAQPAKPTLASRSNDMASQFISNQPAMPETAEHDLAARILAKLSTDEVNQRLNTWLTEGVRHVLAIGPGDQAFATEADLERIAQAVQLEHVIPPKPPVALERLMEATPEPGKIVTKKHLDAVGVTTWKLQNGARVAFKREPDQDQTQLLAFSPGGLARRGEVDVSAARLSAQVMAASGLGNHAAAPTAQFLSERSVILNPWVRVYEEGFRGRAPTAQLETLLQALHLMIADPGRDVKGFEQLRREARARSASSIRSESFRDQIASALRPGDPLYAPLAPGALDAVDWDIARSFFTDRFGDVGDFTFLFHGNADERALEALVETYLASLPGTARKEASMQPTTRRRPGVTRVRVAAGPRETSTVQMEFHGALPLGPERRMLLPQLVSVVEKRLTEVLRERETGTYGVQAWAVFGTPPEREYGLAFRFDCVPPRVEALKAAALQVMSDLSTRGPTEGEIRALTNASKNAAGGYRASFWLRQLADAYRRGEDPNALLQPWKRVPSLTANDLRRAAREFIHLDRYVDAVLIGTPGDAGAGAPLP